MYKNPIQKHRSYARSLGSNFHKFNMPCRTVLWPAYMSVQKLLCLFLRQFLRRNISTVTASNNVNPVDQLYAVHYLLI